MPTRTGARTDTGASTGMRTTVDARTDTGTIAASHSTGMRTTVDMLVLATSQCRNSSRSRSRSRCYYIADAGTIAADTGTIAAGHC